MSDESDLPPVTPPSDTRGRVRPLTENMILTLGDIGHGRGAYARCHGRSEHGGQFRTLAMLVRRGLLTGNGHAAPFRLTPEGLAVVWAEKQ